MNLAESTRPRRSREMIALIKAEIAAQQLQLTANRVEDAWYRLFLASESVRWGDWPAIVHQRMKERLDAVDAETRAFFRSRTLQGYRDGFYKRLPARKPSLTQ